MSYLEYMMQSGVQSTPLFSCITLPAVLQAWAVLCLVFSLQVEKQKLKGIGDLSTFTWLRSRLLKTSRSPKTALGTLSSLSLNSGAQLKYCPGPGKWCRCSGLHGREGRAHLKVCCPAPAHGGMPPRNANPVFQRKLDILCEMP